MSRTFGLRARGREPDDAASLVDFVPGEAEIAPEAQRVDTAGGRAYAFREVEQGACFQLLNNLFLDAPVEVEFKAVLVIRHDHRILQGGKRRCPTVIRSQPSA